MKAVRIHTHGGPNVLNIDEIPAPLPGPGEVLLRMKAAALNHLDIFVRNGIPGVPLPLIMGSDGAGIVEAVGAHVQNANVADEVIHVPMRFPNNDPYRKKNLENLSPDFKIPGEHLDGVQCQYIVVEERYLLPKPHSLSWHEAAALPLASLTAYHMLARKAHLQKDDWVLIYGASSGVGGAAIQIAKTVGARVITTAGSEEKMQLARSFGADHIINYKQQSPGKAVREITEGRGVDIVVEHTGAATWRDSLRALKTGGKLVTCGATTGPLVQIDLRALFIKQQQLIGSTMGSIRDLKEVCLLADAGNLRPHIGHVFAMDEIAEAHQALESGRYMGKLILTL